MEAYAHELLKALPDAADVSAAAHAGSAFVDGLTLIGGLVSKGAKELHLAVEDGTTFSIPLDGVVSLRPTEEPNYRLPGTTVAIRVKNGTRVVSARVLEVGKDIVPTTAPGQVGLLACPPQCKDPKTCGNGCCCDGKKCQGASCV